MLVAEFNETCHLYQNFQVWEIENIDAFFKGNQVLATIFKDHYAMPIEEFHDRRSEIAESDMEIIQNLLSMVDDKSFFIFTFHDKNHLELVGMQQMKVMNFGMDIEQIKHDHVYVMIMDKMKSTKFN